MKLGISIICIAILCLAVISFTASQAKEQQKGKNYVKVFYFHGDQRCSTCLTIEKYTKEAVNEIFKDEMKAGKVKLEVVNYDKKKNEHYLNDYKLFNQALIIVKYKNGKQISWKDSPKIWEYVSNRGDFFEYVKKEVKEYLKDM